MPDAVVADEEAVAGEDEGEETVLVAALRVVAGLARSEVAAAVGTVEDDRVGVGGRAGAAADAGAGSTGTKSAGWNADGTTAAGSGGTGVVCR